MTRKQESGKHDLIIIVFIPNHISITISHAVQYEFDIDNTKITPAYADTVRAAERSGEGRGQGSLAGHARSRSCSYLYLSFTRTLNH